MGTEHKFKAGDRVRLNIYDGPSYTAKNGAEANVVRYYVGVNNEEYIDIKWDRKDKRVGHQMDGGYYENQFELVSGHNYVYDVLNPLIEASEKLCKSFDKEPESAIELKNGMSPNGDTTGCGGKRYNTGKLMWRLVPFESLKQTVQVLMMGREKYGEGNWQKGMSWLVCWECLMRHAIAWRSGETKDAESGLNHLSHVIANAIFLIWYGDNNKGVDDRLNENL